MGLDISWIGSGLTPVEGGFLLPDLLLTPTGDTAPYPFGIRVATDSADHHADLIADELRRAWERHVSDLPLPLGSPWRLPGAYLPAHLIAAGDAVQLSAVVDFTDAGPDGRSQSVPRRTRLATVLVEAVAAAEPFPGPSVSVRVARPKPRPEVRSLGTPERPGRDHNGWAAIDLGTTTCTVTIFDRHGWRTLELYPSERATLQSGLLDLLATAPPGSDVEWRSVLQDARTDLRSHLDESSGLFVPAPLPDAADDLLQLIRQDRDDIRLTHRLLLILDRIRGRCTDVLRDWLAHRLHLCYDQAFSIQSFDYNRTYPAELGAGEDLVASRVAVTGVDPLTARLGDAVYGVDGSEKILGTVHNLKEHYELPKVELTVGDKEVRTWELFAAAVDWLLREAERFVDRHPAMLDRGVPFDHVLITYPTMASPDVRDNIVAALGSRGLGITQVDTGYDEAIAAALFYVTRDLGTDLGLGLEAMRARMRPIDGNPRERVENMLVADIGGSTLDTAVVTLRMSETTPDLDPKASDRAGRYYRLVPTLRGTVGESHRGGNALTLRVFHWIKAELADWLLTEGRRPGRGDDQWIARSEAFLQNLGGIYEPGSFVRNTLKLLEGEGLSVEPLLSSPLHNQIDQVLKTTWSDALSSGFGSLWDLAEEAKIELGADKPAVLTADKLDAVLRASARVTDLPYPECTAEITLDPGIFQRLVKDLVVRSVKLAVDLARAGLNEGERLDRVVLSGRGSRLPLVARLLDAELRARPGGAGEPDLSGARIIAEQTFAKQAASAGACIAEAYRQDHLSEAGAKPELEEGRSRLWLNTANIFRNLPCAFSKSELGYDGIEIAEIGAPFEEGPDGIGYIRCDYGKELKPSLDIDRRVPGGSSHPWGLFKRRATALREGLVPDETGEEQWERELRREIEIDQWLGLRLYIWRGEHPHYRVEQRGFDLPEAARQKKFRVGGPGELAAMLRVLSTSSGDEPPRQVFTRPEPQAMFFLEGTAGELRHAWISDPLPELRENRTFTFTLGTGKDERTVTVLQAPPGKGRIRASLDDHGELRLHNGMPPYRLVDTLGEARDTPGTVYLGRFDYQPKDNNADDPFNGRQ